MKMTTDDGAVDCKDDGHRPPMTEDEHCNLIRFHSDMGVDGFLLLYKLKLVTVKK